MVRGRCASWRVLLRLRPFVQLPDRRRELAFTQRFKQHDVGADVDVCFGMAGDDDNRHLAKGSIIVDIRQQLLTTDTRKVKIEHQHTRTKTLFDQIARFLAVRGGHDVKPGAGQELHIPDSGREIVFDDQDRGVYDVHSNMAMTAARASIYTFFGW
jgi:hypothetical protein